MAPQENPKNIPRKFLLDAYRQQMGEFTMGQLQGLDPKEQERVRRSANTLKETYHIAQAIGHSFEDSQLQIDSIDAFRKNASLGVLYASCGLFVERVIDRLSQPAQKVIEKLMPDVIELKENVKNELSIQVGDISIQDFTTERSDNPQDQTTHPLGSYFTLLVDLVRTNNDPAVLESIIQQNQNKKLNPDELKLAVLSSGSLAAAMLVLHDLDRNVLVGKNKKTAAAIEKEAGQLLHATALLQGEIFATLSRPESPQFSSVKDSVQPYLFSQDVNTKNLCISALTREDMGHFVILYRTAQESIDKGVETEFYQSVANTIEEVAQYRNQSTDKIFIITKQQVPTLLDSKQAIPSEETPTLEEITELSKNLSLPRSKEPLHVDPQIVKQSGLATPTNITVESRQDNSLLVSFWYQSEDGKPLEFAVQFPVGKKNPDPREFRWNALPDPQKEPQLHAAAMRATKAVINNSKEQIEERKINQEPRITTVAQTPPKKSPQQQESGRQDPPQNQKDREKRTPISKDQEEKEPLNFQEQRLAEESFSSPASFEVVKGYIDFPKDVRDLAILDIGGGASTATLELRKKGANAFAIDYRYKDLKELKRNVDRYLTKPAFLQQQIDKLDVEKELEKASISLAEIPAGVDPNLWALTQRLTIDQLRSPKGRELLNAIKQREAQANRIYVREGRKARDIFFGNIERGNRPYVAAVAGVLPLKDEAFDLCFSVQCVSFFLINDKDVFMQSVSEGLRVLKSGGQLQLHPWIANPLMPWEPHKKENAEAFMQYLKDQGMEYSVEQISPMSSPRLRIIKE